MKYLVKISQRNSTDFPFMVEVYYDNERIGWDINMFMWTAKFTVWKIIRQHKRIQKYNLPIRYEVE